MLQPTSTFVYRVGKAMMETIAALYRNGCRASAPARFGLVAALLIALPCCPTSPPPPRRDLSSPAADAASDGALDVAVPEDSLPNVEDSAPPFSAPDQQAPPQSDGEQASPVPPPMLAEWDHPDGKVLRGKAWRLHRQAHKALRANDFVEAERLWTEAVDADHSFEAAYGALCVVHMRSKNHEACVEASQRCVKSVFDSGRLGACYYNLGKCLEHLGDEDSALEAYRNSLEFRDNATVERAYLAIGKGLGREVPTSSKRAAAEALTKAAATVFLRRNCKSTVSFERPGIYVCGPMTVWGEAGGFTSADGRDVVLIVHDERLSRADRKGYGVLLSLREGGWHQRAKTRLLAPGEGGVDFHAAPPLDDGRRFALVQVTDCSDGCCHGSFGTLEFRPSGEGLRVLGKALVSVGSGRNEPDGSTKKALVTGTRRIDEDGDGVADLLLARYETRRGSYNPTIYYLRYQLQESSLQLRGDSPPRDALPRCRPRADG